jgi:hypothetical protein
VETAKANTPSSMALNSAELTDTAAAAFGATATSPRQQLEAGIIAALNQPFDTE